MGKSERERRHQANLERINLAQRVIGKGDRMRVDHEGTLLDRARMLEEEISSHLATERGLAALDRLLRRAEDRRDNDGRDIAAFITAVWHQQPLRLATLRGVESGVADDMLTVLDAFRHSRLTLPEHVDGGVRRVTKVLDAWKLANA